MVPKLIWASLALVAVVWGVRLTWPRTVPERKGVAVGARVMKSDEEWRQQLTAEQFHVTREHGTERAGTGIYANCKKDGTYACICCGQPLFDSHAKYESGTGWPSFWEPVAPDNVAQKEDRGWLGTRTEVVCSRCDAHLGHVFADGPRPTGLRYCMNSAALRLIERGAESSAGPGEGQ